MYEPTAALALLEADIETPRATHGLVPQTHGLELLLPRGAFAMSLVKRLGYRCDQRRESRFFPTLGFTKLQETGLVVTHSRNAPCSLITHQLLGKLDHVYICKDVCVREFLIYVMYACERIPLLA